MAAKAWGAGERKARDASKTRKGREARNREKRQEKQGARSGGIK
jgi:hypothetical protein